jgi:16S rRNA (guanine527-N7)-methyltransferase
VTIPSNVSCETYKKLEIYKNLLLKWQKSINLVSRGTLHDVWTEHIFDSLQIIPHIVGEKVLDIGSGGGFPGMVLAIAGSFSVTCIDSDRRKMIFLSEVAKATDTKVHILVERIENLQTDNFDTICARGFSELSNLLKIVHRFSAVGVFFKGSKLNEEIEKAHSLFNFQYETYENKIKNHGKIVVVKSVKKK